MVISGVTVVKTYIGGLRAPSRTTYEPPSKPHTKGGFPGLPSHGLLDYRRFHKRALFREYPLQTGAILDPYYSRMCFRLVALVKPKRACSVQP